MVDVGRWSGYVDVGVDREVGSEEVSSEGDAQ